MKSIYLLTALNENYLPRLQVMLTSLAINYPKDTFALILLHSGGAYDMPWVMQHTAILHFCGKEKPWKPRYIHRFGILYQHYMQLTRQGWGVSL